MVLSASAHITGPAGERTCPVEALFAGPSACSLAPGDIVTRISIPLPVGKGAYFKLMRRVALDLAFVGVAAYVHLDATNVCTEVKIALGAVAPTPVRATAAESALLGTVLTEETAAQAGTLAGTECRPITDMRASQEYRCSMVEVSPSAPCSRP
jgi:carbon-monoxide dehydrogenase medium subunit